MSTAYELIYHKELNMFNCFCGYMDLHHHCKRKIKDCIKIVSCPTDCRVVRKKQIEKNTILSAGKPLKTATVSAGHVMIN